MGKKKENKKNKETEILQEKQEIVHQKNKEKKKKLLNENSFCNNCNSKEKLTIDHIIPISKGGKNLESNVQILCGKCNLLKKDKI